MVRALGAGRERLGELGVFALEKKTLMGQFITTFTHQTGVQSKDGFHSEANTDTVATERLFLFMGLPCNCCPKRF